MVTDNIHLSNVGVSKLSLSERRIRFYTIVQGPDISRKMVVSGYVTIYQINKFIVNVLFSHH